MFYRFLTMNKVVYNMNIDKLTLTNHVLSRRIWLFPLQPRRLGTENVLGRLKQAPPHMCYYVQFLSSSSKSVVINIDKEEPQNWGALGLCPFKTGPCLTPKTTTNKLQQRVYV